MLPKKKKNLELCNLRKLDLIYFIYPFLTWSSSKVLAYQPKTCQVNVWVRAASLLSVQPSSSHFFFFLYPVRGKRFEEPPGLARQDEDVAHLSLAHGETGGRARDYSCVGIDMLIHAQTWTRSVRGCRNPYTFAHMHWCWSTIRCVEVRPCCTWAYSLMWIASRSMTVKVLHNRLNFFCSSAPALLFNYLLHTPHLSIPCSLQTLLIDRLSLCFCPSSSASVSLIFLLIVSTSRV